jgi:hypothetical protein
VTGQDAGIRECPFCREEVKAQATRCKHCHAAIPAEAPGHGGVCPLCKEDIKPDAVRCRHCQADLRPGARSSDCGCGGASSRAAAGATRLIVRRVPSGPGAGRRLFLPPGDCNDFEFDEDGTAWCFLQFNPPYDCEYVLCDVADSPRPAARRLPPSNI